MYKNVSQSVAEIRQLVYGLERELNSKVETFQKETGIKVVLHVEEPRAQYMGQIPVPTIRVGAYILED